MLKIEVQGSSLQTNIYKCKSKSFWNTVIFADESKINLFRIGWKSYVWRKANAELQPQTLHSTVKLNICDNFRYY